MTPTTIPDCPYDDDCIIESLRNPNCRTPKSPGTVDKTADDVAVDGRMTSVNFDAKVKSYGNAASIGNDANLPDLVLGEFLVLPQSFGYVCNVD